MVYGNKYVCLLRMKMGCYNVCVFKKSKMDSLKRPL